MLALIYVLTIWCVATILYASVDRLETKRRLALVLKLLIFALGRDRRMIAPDEPGEQRDGNADQRRADEEIREARTLDDEARGARKQASRQCAERSH